MLYAAVFLKKHKKIFSHIPTDVPGSAALSIASTATDGVSPMPDWKHSQGRPPKTWLKQITVDLAAEKLQLATDRPTWRAVTMEARLHVQ